MINQRTHEFGEVHWIAEFIRKTGQAHGPVFRKQFTAGKIKNAECRICGLGFFELYINGCKIGDDVMTPDFTRYDRHALYYVYNVSKQLRQGENIAEIRLGNGFFNEVDPDVWRCEGAEWRSDPKFIMNLVADGQSILVSDTSWLVAEGPVTFNGIRTGEHYDARRQIPDWMPGETPDQTIWNRVYRTDSPGGELVPARGVPCRLTQRLAPVKTWKLHNNAQIFDFGVNIAGFTEIEVVGEAGAKVIIDHAERLNPAGDLDNIHNAQYTLKGDFQRNIYTLQGRADGERWHPAFTYHGFQFAKITIDGNAELRTVTGCVVRSGFDEIGAVETSVPMLNRIVECAKRSYESNFVGMPTDCPHREKLGWTGDAALACELGLWFYRAAGNYRDWLQSMGDCQRPSGQVPGIVPIAKHWQFGPVWDGALILIPYEVYRFTGDSQIVCENYAAGVRLMEYFDSLAQQDLIEFGPGDWCHVERERAIAPEIDASAIWKLCADCMRQMAPIAGHDADVAHWAELSRRIAAAFHAKYYHGDGHYALDEMTALALALTAQITPPGEVAPTAARLNKLVCDNQYRIDFGIVGAKYVPRALAAHGYIDTALELLTQPEFPGWGWWIRQGATTLWETWLGHQSLNHVMFGDVGAWTMEFALGLAPDDKAPGFKHFFATIPDCGKLEHASGTHLSPHGEIHFAWRRTGERRWHVELHVPDGCQATVNCPGGSPMNLAGGTHEFDL